MLMAESDCSFSTAYAVKSKTSLATITAVYPRHKNNQFPMAAARIYLHHAEESPDHACDTS
jgi:hypothetical protein